MPTPRAYFFAQYPKDFALCAGLAAVLRSVRPDVPLELIASREPNSAGYDWSIFESRFDRVRWVDYVLDRHWRHAFNARGLIRAYTRTFPRIRRIRAQFARIELEPGSVAFAFDGYSLNQAMFLRHAEQSPDVRSVLIMEATEQAALSDFIVGVQESLYLSLAYRSFGTADVDVYWMRPRAGGTTSQREVRFRSQPADYTFYGQHAALREELAPGQAFFPFLGDDVPRETPGDAVVFGGIFEWEPLIGLDAFYKRYNELIEVIRVKHKGSRLVYLPHPAPRDEADSEVSRLDLRGFEVVRGTSAEAFVAGETSIASAYAVVSTALVSAANLGVQPHFLYPLFDVEAIAPELATRYDERWAASGRDWMVVRSLEELRADGARGELAGPRARAWNATVGLLAAVGLVEPTGGHHAELTPESRWAPRSNPALLGTLNLLLGVPSLGGVVRHLFRRR